MKYTRNKVKRSERPKWWASNYSLKEKTYYLRDRVFLPYSKNKYDFDELAPRKIIYHNTNSNLTIGFLGDIMPINKQEIALDDELKRELASLDILVANLEGIITQKRRVLALSHDISILNKIKTIAPNAKIFINLANNHSADFGKEEFEQCKKILRDNGFEIFGHKNKPYLDYEKIRLFAATYWSNQKIECANPFDYSGYEKINSYLDEKKINILLPHWGYEMQLYPTKEQQRFIDKVDKWHLIVGNHSHCPQPMLSDEKNKKITAFSLGNFCYSHYNTNHYGGAFLKVSLNTQSDIPSITSANFLLTQMNFDKKNIIKISSVKKLDYKKIRIKSLKRRVLPNISINMLLNFL